MFKEIFSSRNTILELSRNDFKNRYAGSLVGSLWAFIQPLITILIYWFVFQVGFRTTPIDNVPFIVWFVCGIVPWFYFSDALIGGSTSITDYGYIVKKVMFSVRVLPIVKVMVATFVHLFFVALVFIICFSVGLPLDLHSLQIFYYSLCVLVLATGASYLTAALVPFSKDLAQIVSIVLQFGFWLTPIVWNLNLIPAKWLFVFKLNPMYYVVEGYRDSLINHHWFWERPLSTLYFWVVALIIFYVGMLVFNRLKSHFADVL